MLDILTRLFVGNGRTSPLHQSAGDRPPFGWRNRPAG